MNAMRLAVAWGSTIFVTSLGFAACGGSDSPGESKDPSRTDGGKTDSGDNDPPTEEDAGTDAQPPDEGYLQCNDSPCDLSDQHCCVAANGTQSCNANSGASCKGAAEVHCDEKGDCDNGNLCCGESRDNRFITSCKRSTQCQRNSYQYQICKTSAECADGSTCKTQRCNGVLVSSCGGIPVCQ